ncbi:tetratricopeptide repeat protein [Kitasatospora sp. NPDC059327]|uniref:tetratricopeptide repeat protein n=1 Tax=Kitasatospora sp. NPDC059327 TaxID=3346803 RepID=UPI00368992F0
MLQDRVVVVDGPSGRGSGYLIGPALVLTSAHVVCDASVVPLGRPGAVLVPGTVVWRGTGGGRDDAALVRVDDPRWQPPHGTAPRWGELVTDEVNQECVTTGVPRIAEFRNPATHRSVADQRQLSGTVNPGSGYLADRYLVDLRANVSDWPSGGLPWGGLSGAALLSRDFVIGVIAAEVPYSGHGAVAAVPSSVLLRDPEFRAALARFGADPVRLHPVEFDELIAREPAGLDAAAGVPSALLRPERETVGFHGREELLAELVDWCREDDIAALLVHGPGGAGKTRLARELATRLTSAAEDREDRWAVVWLRAPQPPGASHGSTPTAAQPVDRLRRTGRRVLVVLDYAENRLDQLALLLEAACRRDEPFKVLLLARTAGDWWEQARRHTRLMEDLLGTYPPVALPPLAEEPGARPALYRAAADAFAARMGGPWPAVAAGLPEPDLDHPGFANTLTLHMTALADLLDAGPAGEPRPPVPATRLIRRRENPEDVESRLLGHENRYWGHVLATRDRAPRAPEAELFKDALALSTLVGAADDVLGRVRGLADEGLRGHVGDWLADAYPPDRSGRDLWGAIQPDRLAERFAGERVLNRRHLLPALVTDLDPVRAERLLTVLTRAAGHRPLSEKLAPLLTRLCTDHPDRLAGPALAVAPQVERPEPLLDALDALISAPGVDAGRLAGLVRALPAGSHRLGPLAIRLLERLVELRRAPADGGVPELLDLVTGLRELSKWYFDAGEHAAALAVVEEAVERLEPTTGAHGPDGPDGTALRNKLAGCLANRAGILTSLGRPREALRPATRGAALYRELADRSEVEKPEHLPIALAILARVHNELGDPRSALPLEEEVVELRKPLAASGAADRVADLARGMNNLAQQYRKAGDADRALARAGEAVDLLRPLARRYPDAQQPLLAELLGTQSLCLTDSGDSAGALRAAEESVAIRRRLAAGRPGAYRYGLAQALNSLSHELSRAGRATEAMAAAVECVELGELLDRDQPGAYRDQLATSLNTLSNHLSDANRPEEAVRAAERAVALYAELHRELPDAYAADHAMALCSLGLRLDDLGRPEESLAHLEHAARVYRALPAHLAGPARPDLARCLNNIAAAHRWASRDDEALAASEEGLALARELASANPRGFGRLLAGLLATRALCLHQAGRHEESAAVAAEGVEAATPTAAEPETAEMLSLLSSVLSLAHRTEEALDAKRRVVAARRALARIDGPRHHPGLLEALDSLRVNLHAAGRYEEAAEIAAEAVGIHRDRWESERTADRQAALADALAGLGDALEQLDRPDEADRLTAESVALWRDLPGPDRNAHQPSPALALASHADRLWSAGQCTEALAVLNEAAEGFGHLPETDQARHAGTAMVFTTRGSALHSLGDPASLPDLDRAVAAARSVSDTGLRSYAGIVGRALLVRARVRAERGLLEEAVPDAVAAADAYRRMRSTQPVQADSGLITAQMILGLILARTGRADEAREASAEALALARTAPRTPTDLTLPTVLAKYAQVRLLVGADLDAGLAAADESIALLRSVAEQHPALVESALDEVLRIREELDAAGVAEPARGGRVRPEED